MSPTRRRANPYGIPRSDLEGGSDGGFSYGALAKDYARLWHAMKIPPAVLAAADARVRAIARSRPRYDQVANATGVPWFVSGIIHDMEAGLKFTAHLHKGDPLSARTSHQPAGRPPFGLPLERGDSAIDALAMKKLDEVKLWTIKRSDAPRLTARR
jgi:lysozyme family protein